MFKLLDGRKEMFQWDLDRKLIVEDRSIKEVHFCNKTDDCSLVVETYVEDGLTLANVPNILLQTDWKINVYAYDKNYTKHCDVFKVVGRTKPTDYVYEEVEIINLEVLKARVEEGLLSIGDKTNEGLQSIETKTEESVQAIENGIQAISNKTNDSLTTIGNKTEESLNAIEAEYQENKVNNANIFANAIKGFAEGGIVRLDDVSTIPHTMKVKVSGVEDMSAVNLECYGKNLIDDEAMFEANKFTKLEDGRWLGKNTKYVLFENKSLTPGRFSYSLNFQRTDESIGRGVMVFVINYVDGYTEYRNSNDGLWKYTTQANRDVKKITISFNTTGTFYISNFQLEYGETNTEYEPYRCESFTPNEDGSVDGVVGYDNATLTTNAEGASVSVEYNRDTNAVIEQLTQAIISLGGNI